MDQERLSSLAVCSIQRETANKVLNNDTELLINKFAGKHGRAYCICSIRISLYCMNPV